MSKQKPFILIDGSSYLYRAFHALPPLTNSRGEPTGAIYGVTNMIRKLLNQYEPEYIAVVFDAKGKTFRDAMYKEYKAHRPPMPDDLVRQVQPLKELIQAMGLPLLEIEGVEADDVIATLAIQAKKKNWSVLISTGDKDMAQLVDDQIHLINTMTGVILDRKGVQEKFGIKPEQIIDYLALMGDSVDNVPGVPKVGPKTAVKWLDQYQTLDNIMQHANEFTGKIGENLRNALPALPLSKQLVTLCCNIPLPFSLEDLKYHSSGPGGKLIDMVKHLEFRTWLQDLLSGIPQASAQEIQYHTVLTQDDWQRWYKQLFAAKEFAFDTETTSLNAIDAEIVGFSFSFKPFEAVYVPLKHSYEGAPQQLDRETILQQLKIILEDPDKTIIGHNLKYDMMVLTNHGIQMNANIFDTMMESYVLDSNATRHNMDALALKFLSRKTIQFEELAGKGAKQLTFDQVTLEKATPYACQDADVALQLHQQFWQKFLKDEDLKTVLLDIELPLVPVLAQIEKNGVMIDSEKLAEQSRNLAIRIEQLEQEAYQLAGVIFNLASPKQLQEILYQKMQLPVLSKTPTGIPSTAEDVLQELALNFPLPKIILEYRGLCKLKSTYTDALPKQINPHTHRVHTSYNQAVTATGRLSSTDPNLQNIPIKNEEGRRIRQAFIAPPGYKIVSADYSQIELRIMAHLSQDEGLLAAFSDGHDIHTATAAEVFNLPLHKVSAEQRRHAKAINFGLIYGMSAFGLAKQLNIDRHVAQKYMDLYFKRYPKVQFYMEVVRELAHKQGYVETLLGRRLYVPEINASNMQRRRAAERAAINAPMQGTAADIIKVAMISLHAWLLGGEVDAKMIMQVHDELVFEVAEKDLEKSIAQIDYHMTHALELSVPLVVQTSFGDNWDEAH